MRELNTVLQIIRESGGFQPGKSISIENGPWTRLIIEVLPETGPDGHLVVSCDRTQNLAGAGTIIWPSARAVCFRFSGRNRSPEATQEAQSGRECRTEAYRSQECKKHLVIGMYVG